MNYAVLLKNIESYVTEYFEADNNPSLYYHNLSHTQSVVESTIEIASHYQLDDRSYFIVCAAAWFHDLGYLVDTENHEFKSGEMATPFLKENKVSDEDIAEIRKCIMATKMPQTPVTLLDQIICDSDLFYLGTKKFKKISKQFIKETETIKKITISDYDSLDIRIKFLQSHNYHTDYCRNLLDLKKDENQAEMQSKQEKIVGGTLDKVDSGIKNIERKKKKKKGKGGNDPVRGVQTMFRVSTTNSVRVSVMADNKAHIMISVNSIIISIVLAFLVRNVEAYIHFLIPTIMLVTVNMVTITYAVLATRPKVAEGRFTEKQVEDKSVNLLFFGSFYNMEYPEYHEAVNKMMVDPEFLYGNLTKDVYWQGKVLGRKYKLLRTAYNIFMYGMIVTVFTFLLAAILFG